MARVYRVRGIPLGWDADRVMSFLAENYRAEPSFGSLACEVHGRSQSATVSFQSIASPPPVQIRLSPANQHARPQIVMIDDDFYGITSLYVPPAQDHKVDIVALSGLGGHAFGSFKQRGGEYMWIRDSLPYDLTLGSNQTCGVGRVMLYGYDSVVNGSSSFQNLEDLATSLRDSLRPIADNADPTSPRPILFIAHSLGGLILKQMFTMLTKSEKDEDLSLLNLIYGAAFFGVPNDGMDIGSIISMAADAPNRSLVESISHVNSQILSILRRDFHNAFGKKGGLDIVFFYETRKSPTAKRNLDGTWKMNGPDAVLVTKSSATQGRHWEDRPEYTCAVDRTHSEMVKFKPEDHEYDKVLQRLRDLVKRVLMAPPPLARKEVQSISPALGAEQIAVLDRLSIAKGAPFNSQDEESNPTCLENTRVELLQQISTWIHNPSAKALFWLNGMAGTGKSTISRTIARSLSGTNQLGASFFFKRGEADRGNATKFITTIARQLADKEPRVVPRLMKVIETDSTISGSAIQEQFQKLIFEPLSKIILSGPLVIIVDALDECEGDDKIRSILNLFTRMHSPQIPRVKVFMTSRPELPIRLGFSDAKDTYQDFILHEIKSEIIEHDISIFLEHEFRSIRDDYNRTVAETRRLPPDWPNQPTIKALMDIAIPLFISAATACRFISDRRYGTPNELLEEMIAHKGRSGSSGLSATYLPILNRQIIDVQSKQKKTEIIQQFRKVVGTIIILESPLSSSALAKLLNVSQETIDVRLDMLHSVLHVPSSSKDPVRLLHLSFRDFLVNPETWEETPLGIDEKQMHQDTVIHCFRIMKEKLRRDICDLRKPGIARSDIDQKIIANNIPPELEYACLHWFDHLNRGTIHVSDNELRLFLSNHLLHWIEVLSLTNHVVDGIRAMLRLKKLLKGNSYSHQLLDLVQDSCRFLLHSKWVIENAPLQTYESALIFSPANCLIRSIFRKEEPKWIELKPKMENTWNSCQLTSEDHNGPVYSVAFSPDHQHLASASDDKTIKIWNIETGYCEATLEGLEDSVWSVAYSPDGQRLASASGEGIIMLWDIMTKNCELELEGHNDRVRSVVFSPHDQLLASASFDKTVKLWDIKTGQCQVTLEGHNDWIFSIAFSPDRQHLASASQDKSIKIWNLETGYCEATLEGLEDSVRSVTYSPDSQYLASASDYGILTIWGIKAGDCKTIEGHTMSVCSVVFSPDSQRLASASDDRTIKIWDAKTGHCWAVLEGHGDWVHSVAFSSDGQYLASASEDGTIKIWDATIDYYKDTLEDYSITVGSTTSSPDGQREASLESHEHWIDSLAISPDGIRLAMASEDGMLKIWNTITSHFEAITEGHGYYMVGSLAFSPDNHRLASASDNGTIQIWDITAGDRKVTLKRHTNWVRSIAFSPGGQHLASASFDGTIIIWNTDTGDCQAILIGHSDPVHSVTFSPDGQHLASVSSNKTVRIWDARTGRFEATLEDYNYCIHSAASSPNCRRYSLASYDIIKIWDALTGNCQPTVQGHGGWRESIAFSSDGQRLALTSDNRTVKIWDVMTDHCEARTSHPLPASISLDHPYRHQGYGISADHAWITYQGQNLLWLPSKYRPQRSSINGSTVALGCSLGQVLLFRFSVTAAH